MSALDWADLPQAVGPIANPNGEMDAPLDAAQPMNTESSEEESGYEVTRSALDALYTPTASFTEEAFCDWIAGALVGQSIQYHHGLLLRDRCETHSALPAKERLRLHALARRAWIACELGLVHLFSLRVGEGHYRYIAVRSGNSLTPAQIRTEMRGDIRADSRANSRANSRPSIQKGWRSGVRVAETAKDDLTALAVAQTVVSPSTSSDPHAISPRGPTQNRHSDRTKRRTSTKAFTH